MSYSFGVTITRNQGPVDASLPAAVNDVFDAVERAAHESTHDRLRDRINAGITAGIFLVDSLGDTWDEVTVTFTGHIPLVGVELPGTHVLHESSAVVVNVVRYVPTPEPVEPEPEIDPPIDGEG